MIITLSDYDNWVEDNKLHLLKPSVHAFLCDLAQRGDLVSTEIHVICKDLWSGKFKVGEIKSAWWGGDPNVHITHQTVRDNHMSPVTAEIDGTCKLQLSNYGTYRFIPTDLGYDQTENQ